MDRYVRLPDIQSTWRSTYSVFNSMDITDKRAEPIELGNHWWLYSLGYRLVLPAPRIPKHFSTATKTDSVKVNSCKIYLKLSETGIMNVCVRSGVKPPWFSGPRLTDNVKCKSPFTHYILYNNVINMTENTKISFLDQVQKNAVALISLVIAVTSLSYNTWRNELTEYNRNQKLAAFEVLLKLNELQQVIFHHRFDNDVKGKGNPRTGWTYVLTIRDFSLVLQQPVPESAKQLVEVWGARVGNLNLK